MDHPRSRGEYLGSGNNTRPTKGSSPLSRGIQAINPDGSLEVGIIPALAGNTYAKGFDYAAMEDHPRSRGEYLRPILADLSSGGSSPLSRGIRKQQGNVLTIRGIIPALAGNTATRSSAQLMRADHPRSRGEYATKHPLVDASRGSSPLSRGIPNYCCGGGYGPGIIPALAGNTLAGLVAHRLGKRIIPALAGNTPHPAHAAGTTKDHPRSRGEYLKVRLNLFCETGSSPLSRGILPKVCRLGPSWRIIPALAGNTIPIGHQHHTMQDHPRSRGEYATIFCFFSFDGGSSPLSRGIRCGAAHQSRGRGIIPALAGNTFG